MARGNQVRIIGGRHRGRRLTFPAVADLRPTADRLRETLFNWLQGELPGARCLDLFAGSGALGFEALSRGAAYVELVERVPAVARQLRQNLARLEDGDQARVIQRDALRWLQRPPQTPFDLVFLDPPFKLDLLGTLSERLEAGGWLAPRAWIYMEQPSHRPWFDLPPGWHLHRRAQAGQANCRLIRRQGTVC